MPPCIMEDNCRFQELEACFNCFVSKHITNLRMYGCLVLIVYLLITGGLCNYFYRYKLVQLTINIGKEELRSF